MSKSEVCLWGGAKGSWPIKGDGLSAIRIGGRRLVFEGLPTPFVLLPDGLFGLQMV